MSAYQWKIATEPEEFDQIFRLNYQTFVEEIPQHERNQDGILIDKFHDQNTYLIGLNGDRLIGMMALRDQRPFSLDAKLAELDSYLPEHQSLVEVRLLAVDQSARTGRVLHGLLRLLTEITQQNGWDMGVISATTRQLKLYSRMGFESFGPVVGSEGAFYQPMYVSFKQFRHSLTGLV